MMRRQPRSRNAVQKGGALTARLRACGASAVLLLMALLLWQGEAVRIHAIEHAHPTSLFREALGARAKSQEVTASHRDADHDEATCPLCQEDTFFGHYTKPDAPELAVLAQHRTAIVPALPLSPFRAAPVTRFRIRGPPIFFA